MGLKQRRDPEGGAAVVIQRKGGNICITELKKGWGSSTFLWARERKGRKNT